MFKPSKWRLGLVLVAFAAVALSPLAVYGQKKPSVEDLLKAHLDAIGAADARSPDRSRMLTGRTIMSLLAGGTGQASGVAEIMSKDTTILLNANFESSEYPLERIHFNGKKLDVRQYRPGYRSPIGEFLMSYDEILKEGLLGGVLTSGWAMLHTEDKGPKLKVRGTQKIDGVECYKVSYKPRKGSDLTIRLFFDMETFRHVRTEYERVIAARMGADPASSREQKENRYVLIESFSKFAAAGGLELPMHYEMTYQVVNQTHPLKILWSFDFSNVAFNQPIPEEETDTR